ncbi:glucuronate isomerase [Metabacillus rhizolycopersici]|uniref:Uronate isomerase n=1 Tax=Metabacillus rhizolycopersici TaxID=2875709 RepID=A0ABS7UZT4_9BACI|nr:glucuronate isomerase [Metabacillus rhizolycopersici]MBZ5753845.1 glucuronate isomerase [Metabacillus rhizolycopersici]
MKPFLDKDFLLTNPTAEKLYHSIMKELPIFDYHCHLDPKQIWENQNFENITQIWLAGDHYKWRAMRIHGVSENLITGDASDWEKFEAWAETVPHLFGNPLYHWTHMELRTFFGIDTLLSPETARAIWDECNEKLQTPDFTPRRFIEKSNVQFVGTTDDPTDSLEFHQLIKNDPAIPFVVAPTFRPDGALFIEKPTFQEWLKKLESASNITVDSYNSLVKAMQQRVDFFTENGCSASDHDIPKMVFKEISKDEAEEIFAKRLNNEELTNDEIIGYRSALLVELGKMYADKQWVMQLHMGAIRNNNTRIQRLVGADAGVDSIGDNLLAEGLSRFLDALDQTNSLPRTVLYNLNPRDNYVLGTMIGNFFEEGIPGKVQFGSGWWFNDQYDGMVQQMTDLANLGVLGHFIGMTTDSRSLLSYPRHEYFRRIVCNIIGTWVEEGKAPNDEVILEQMIKNIGFNNVQRYFLER